MEESYVKRRKRKIKKDTDNFEETTPRRASERDTGLPKKKKKKICMKRVRSKSLIKKKKLTSGALRSKSIQSLYSQSFSSTIVGSCKR